MALNPVEALAKFIYFELQASRLFELAPGARRCQRLIDDHGKGDDPLGTVDTGHHFGWKSPVAVPGAKGGARDPRRFDGLLQGDPPFFYGLARQVVEEAVPAVGAPFLVVLPFVVPRHPAVTTVAALTVAPTTRPAPSVPAHTLAPPTVAVPTVPDPAI
jgi:hypothetical protein